jgi:hypothetical protein
MAFQAPALPVSATLNISDLSIPPSFWCIGLTDRNVEHRSCHYRTLAFDGERIKHAMENSWSTGKEEQSASCADTGAASRCSRANPTCEETSQ